MSASAIQWTDAVWNPVTGCDRISPGCAHCYALELAPRLRAMGVAKYQDVRDGGPASGPAFGVTLHEQVLEEPLRWRKPRRVFVNSMSDLFHDEVPDEYIARCFGVMASCHGRNGAPGPHQFQVLTKRPERMQHLLTQPEFIRTARRASGEIGHDWPLPNVWLGVTIENRRFVHRADLLRATPAAVRFISAEPLLGPLVAVGGFFARGSDGRYHPDWPDGHVGDDLVLDGIDWLIAGGESGARHRPIRETWVRDLRDACARAGTAFFFKQWGGRTPKAGGRELDGRTWDEMPARPAVAA